MNYYVFHCYDSFDLTVYKIKCIHCIRNRNNTGTAESMGVRKNSLRQILSA